MEDDKVTFFVIAGLNKRAANEVVKNPELSDELFRVFKMAGDKPRETRQILHSFAIESVKGSYGIFKEFLLNYILDDKIKTFLQFREAEKFIGKFKSEFEEAIGLSIVVTSEDIQKVVSEVAKEHFDLIKGRGYDTRGMIMKRVLSKLKWAPAIEVMRIVDKAIEDIVGYERTSCKLR